MWLLTSAVSPRTARAEVKNERTRKKSIRVLRLERSVSGALWSPDPPDDPPPPATLVRKIDKSSIDDSGQLYEATEDIIVWKTPCCHDSKVQADTERAKQADVPWRWAFWLAPFSLFSLAHRKAEYINTLNVLWGFRLCSQWNILQSRRASSPAVSNSPVTYQRFHPLRAFHQFFWIQMVKSWQQTSGTVRPSHTRSHGLTTWPP